MTWPVAIAIAAAVSVALAGGLLTEIGPWYRALAKPSWQPPDWLFGPAWSVIFGLAALSGIWTWRGAPDEAARILAVSLFALNGGLNILWSLLFFRLRRPDWALLEVVPLWLSVLAIIVVVAPFSRGAAWCLVPYLCWVAFAAYLNLTIVRLNAPFGAARPLETRS